MPIAVVQGTADGDVDGATNPSGWPFIHVDLGADGSHGLRVLGANHNFFNHSWGPDDGREDAIGDPLDQPMIDPGRMLSRSEQEMFARHAVGGFVSAIERNRVWLRTPHAEPASLAKPLAAVQARERGAVVIDDFESNSDIALSSSSTAVTWTVAAIEVDLLDTDISDETEVSNRFFQFSKGVIAEWNKSEYATELAPPLQDLRAARSISFRIAQAPVQNSTCAPSAALTEFQLTLTDAVG